MRGERNAGSRFAVSPLSLPRRAPRRPPRLLRRPGDDDAAAGYFVSAAQRCRGYVLSIIDAPDDRSRERCKSGLRETHSIPKGIFYCVLLCNVRDHAFARVPRVSSRVSSIIKYRDDNLPRRRITFESRFLPPRKRESPYGGNTRVISNILEKLFVQI